jgi:hypothetical protein
MKVIVSKEAVRNLAHSFEIIPPLYSILVDPVTKETISGVHRKEAAKAGKPVREFVLPEGLIEGIAKRLGVTREMAVVTIRQHAYVQRQPSEEESRRELLELAKGFEKMGVAKRLIAQKVVKISGLSKSRTLALLPDRYKQREKANSPGRPKSKFVITQKQKLGAIPEEIAEIGERAPGEPGQVSELGSKNLASPPNATTKRKWETCNKCGAILRRYDCGFLHCANPACKNVRAYPIKK